MFLIQVSIILGSIAFSYSLLISPGWKRINTARFHLNSQRELLEARAGKMQHLDIINAKAQELKTAMAETKERMFSRDEAMDFLKLLNEVIEQTGGVLITMLPYDAKTPLPNAIAIKRSEEKRGVPEEDVKSIYTQMPVQIATRGEYSEIMSFLERLKKCRQLIDVSDLSITTARGNPAEVDARLTLVLYVYENHKI